MMKLCRLRSVFVPFFTISITSLLISCGGSGSSNQMGSFSLSVTDAAIDDIAHVYIEFTGVTIKPAESDAIEFNFDTPEVIDILTLQGSGYQTIVEEELVPAGNYNWIRLHVNAEQDGVMDSYIETNIGTQMELYIPSGSQTGLKLVNGFTVLADGQVDFTVDFDLRKSIVWSPEASGQSVKFKPVLRLIDNTSSGSVSGMIDSALVIEACEDPANEAGAVYVYTGADVVATDVSGAETDPLTSALVKFDGENYYYEVGFLAAGDYTLAYTCDAANDDPEVVDALNFAVSVNATVEESTDTVVDFGAM